MFKHAAALILAASPVLANPTLVVDPMPKMVPPSVIFIPRDSDGIVISVIDYFPGGVVPGGVYYTFDGEMEASTGPVATTQGGALTSITADLPGKAVFLGGAELATAKDMTLQIGTATYRVEAEAGKVWLRDLATGLRYAATAHTAPSAPDATGLKVNPAAFALD